MLFTEARFGVFLITVFLGFWALSRWPAARVLWLLLASAAFYMAWNAELILLVLFSATVDYVAGRAIGASSRPSVRRTWLGVSLFCNLGLLGFFKYANFFLDSGAALGLPLPEGTLDIVLPVGISFYTFQSLSYTIDVYRGELAPRRSFLGFLLYILFFPQLVAGPIVRASRFLPQLDRSPAVDPATGIWGLYRIGLGLTKKLLLADLLAVHLVDSAFAQPGVYSSLECLLAVYGYAFQIYLDFSGYSDIAIGSAAILGFRIPENFWTPYRASSLTEFWRRWHISLSSWLRDYLYIPLGGNRRGRVRTYANLMITMLLGGLWHGAAWTFVAWGALHGVGLAVERMLGIRGQEPMPGWRRAVGVLLTFHLVCFAWVFFRAENFGAAAELLARIGDLAWGTANLPSTVVAPLAVAATAHWLPDQVHERAVETLLRMPAPLRAAVAVGLALVLARVASMEATPFIYYQF